MFLFEVLDVSSYVGTLTHGFKVMAPVRDVQFALRPFGEQFVILSKETFLEEYPKSRRLYFPSLQHFMSFVEKNFVENKDLPSIRRHAEAERAASQKQRKVA